MIGTADFDRFTELDDATLRAQGEDPASASSVFDERLVAWQVDADAYNKWLHEVLSVLAQERLMQGLRLKVILSAALNIGFTTGYMARLELETRQATSAD